jgi:hypothetical protein
MRDIRFIRVLWVGNAAESNRPMFLNCEDNFEILQVSLTHFYPLYFVYKFHSIFGTLFREVFFRSVVKKRKPVMVQQLEDIFGCFDFGYICFILRVTFLLA